jgi:lipopolysaccharide export system permease protein
MRLLSRHILRTFAAPFAWGLLALTGLLLLNQLAQLIDRFGGRGLGWQVMIEAVILALPALLTLTIPMAVLVGTLYAYTNLAADLEMMAMYANGVSVWRMVRPALVAAVVIAIVNFFIFDQLVPISNTRFRTLASDVARLQPTLAFRPMEMNRLQPTTYVLRADDIAAEGGHMRGVTIWDLGRYDSRRVIHADSGLMATSPQGTDLLLTLWDGEIIDVSLLEANRIERTSFANNQIRIRDVANTLERSEGQVSRGDREQSGCELLDVIDEARWSTTDLARQRRVLTRRDLRHLAGLPPLPPPSTPTRPERDPHCGSYRQLQRVLERVLLPGALEAQAPQRPRARQAPMPPIVQTPQDTQRPQIPQDSQAARLQLELQAARDSAAAAAGGMGLSVPQDAMLAESLPVALPQVPDGFLVDPMPGNQGGGPPGDGLLSSSSEVNGMRAQARDAQAVVWQYSVEYHKKIALPLASFCFVLVGVALALKYPRSGIGLVIGGSLVIFLVFYVLLIGGEGLADKGVVSPEVAMYGPVVLFTLVGLAAVASANREMGTSRSVGIVEALVGLFRRRGRDGGGTT